MAKAPLTVVEAIDKALTVLNHHASGLPLGSADDRLSRDVAKQLLHARLLAETLHGFLAPADGAPP